PAGAQAVVSMFALWGLSQLMICVLGILVLVRYRSMVPFVLALVLLEHLGRKLILQFLPMATTGTPPGFYVNLGLFTAAIVGLALPLWSRGNLQTQALPGCPPSRSPPETHPMTVRPISPLPIAYNFCRSHSSTRTDG